MLSSFISIYISNLNICGTVKSARIMLKCFSFCRKIKLVKNLKRVVQSVFYSRKTKFKFDDTIECRLVVDYFFLFEVRALNNK